VLKPYEGDGGIALSPVGCKPLDGRAMPLPSTATHEPMGMSPARVSPLGEMEVPRRTS